MTYPIDELAARRGRKPSAKEMRVTVATPGIHVPGDKWYPRGSREAEPYEMREAQEYQRQLRDVEKAPLADRKEAAEAFLEAMKDPALVAERISWLFDGNYGYGAMQAAKRVLGMSARANKAATLTQMIAALEWRTPPRLAVQAWKKLSSAQKAALDKAVKAEIHAAEKGE